MRLACSLYNFSRSPDLNIGIILAVFIFSGKIPFLKEMLHNIIGVTIGAIIRLTIYILNPFESVESLFLQLSATRLTSISSTGVKNMQLSFLFCM